MATKKFANIESLRGIAALSVVLYHFDIGSHFNVVFVKNSWLMVDFFFVLSGFVIALSYINRINSFEDLISFQKKRFWRLYPLHLLTLFLFVLIETSKYFAETKFGLVGNTPAFFSNNLDAFFANLFLIQNWTLNALTYNYPSWSISAEFYTYAVFGVFVLLAKGNLVRFYLLAIMVIVFSYIVLDEIGMDEGRISGPARCLASFFIGTLTYKAFSILKTNFSFNNSIPSSLIIIVGILCIIFMGSEKKGVIIFIPFIFSLIILSLVLTNEYAYINKLLNNGTLIYLGTISYGIYMIHAFVWWIWTQLLKYVLHAGTVINSDGKNIVSIDNVYLADIITLVGVAVIIFLAHISYCYFERLFVGKA